MNFNTYCVSDISCLTGYKKVDFMKSRYFLRITGIVNILYYFIIDQFKKVILDFY